MYLINVGKAPAAAAYVGPGDVQGGAVFYGALRGYTAAYAAANGHAVDLVDQAGANPITINILTNGNLDVVSIATWVALNTVTTIKVATLYDQSGNAQHLTQATLANMPTLVLSAFGTLPGLNFSGTQSLNHNGGISPLSQPYTWTTVYERTTTGTTFALQDAGATNIFLGGTTSNTLLINAGSNGTATAADNALHAIQAIFNGASSAIIVEGSSTTVSVGAASMNSNNFTAGTAFSQGHVGYLNEIGIYGSNIGAALNSNQRAYWGI